MTLAKIRFDTETCGRCGGSGHYSYNSMDGTVCFKCRGSGKQFTRKGNAARKAFYRIAAELRATPVEDIKVGDRIMSGPFGGSQRWTPVLEISTSEGVTEWTDSTGIRRHWVYLETKYGSNGFPSGSTVERVTPWTPEAVAMINGIKGCSVEWRQEVLA